MTRWHGNSWDLVQKNDSGDDSLVATLTAHGWFRSCWKQMGQPSSMGQASGWAPRCHGPMWVCNLKGPDWMTHQSRQWYRETWLRQDALSWWLSSWGHPWNTRSSWSGRSSCWWQGQRETSSRHWKKKPSKFELCWLTGSIHFFIETVISHHPILKFFCSISVRTFAAQCAAKKVRHFKFAYNFGSDTSNFVQYHTCLCNDHTSQLDLVLNQLGLIHCTRATKPSISCNKKVRHTSEAWVLRPSYMRNPHHPFGF